MARPYLTERARESDRPEAMDSPGDSPMPASPHTPSNADDIILESMEGGGANSSISDALGDADIGIQTGETGSAGRSGFETPRSDADR